ncbi:hypothetical protein Scep_022665 [Stephania cephalantha]|uniref:Cyclin-D1-binding protein 1 n=1 Tax=Stephania cephalantha TaxID=152367 RepID=A0AAP0F6V5_9MAGN
MARAAKERLNISLCAHFDIIHETFQMLDQTPAFSVKKVSWEEVVKMGEQVSKQATVAGMLWTGEVPRLQELEENMKVYFNLLQGFLLLSYESTAGAGPTLSSSIHAAAKHVVDSSFALMKAAVSSYGSRNKDHKLSIPQLAGTVWESCESLKKTPNTNYTAIGRAITQIAVSVKDVLRELKELKPAALDPVDEVSQTPTSDTSDHPHNDGSSSEGDLGNDLSPEEMKIAQSASALVSDTLNVLKELIRFVTGLLKHSNARDTRETVDSLESLLSICQGIGVHVDELGACLYPPQEVPALKLAAESISAGIGKLQEEVRILNGASEGFFDACGAFENSLRTLLSELKSADDPNLETQMQSLAMN